MSLLKALATVAVGYAAARGVDKLSGGDGLQGMLKQMQGGGSQGTTQAGGLQDMLSGLTGGGSSGRSGNVGDLLGGLTGKSGSSGGGGLDDLLGQLTGGSAGSGGAGLGGLLSTLGGAVAGGGNFQDMLSGAAEPTANAEERAGLLLRAMIQAAKSDGDIDQAEQQKILQVIGEADQAEVEFVNAQMAAPLDPRSLAHDTPDDMVEAVYSAALMTVNLDRQAEASFLRDLASGLGIEPNRLNAMHQQIGVPVLYS
jgi:uncharacterized membrane protein YebE (DUF533 family)